MVNNLMPFPVIPSPFMVLSGCAVVLLIIIIECWIQEVTSLCPDLQFRDVSSSLYSVVS